jgi:hypothetical protein
MKQHFKASENNFNNSGRYIPCLMRLHVNHYCMNMILHVTIMATRSKAWVCSHSPAEIVGSNPAGGMDVCLLRVLSGRGLCDEMITRPQESYQLSCVVV